MNGMDVTGCRKRAEALRDEAERFGTRVSVSNTAARLIATDLLTLLDNQRGAVERLRALVDWGWGENAPDNAVRDWKEALAWLDTHHPGGQ